MGPLCAGVVGDVSAAQVEQVPVRVMHQRAPLHPCPCGQPKHEGGIMPGLGAVGRNALGGGRPQLVQVAMQERRCQLLPVRRCSSLPVPAAFLLLAVQD